MSKTKYQKDFDAAWDREFKKLGEEDQQCVLAAPTGKTAARLAVAATKAAEQALTPGHADGGKGGAL